MNRLKEIVLRRLQAEGGGAYEFVENFPDRYIDDLIKRPKVKRKLKVVAACGNGTAGAFAPGVLGAIGCEVVPLDSELDHTFPKYNPNPEDMKMLHAIADKVKRAGPTSASASTATAIAAASSKQGRRNLRRQDRRILARDLRPAPERDNSSST